MNQTYACITLKFGLLLPFKYIIDSSVNLFSTSFVKNSQLAAWSKKWILNDRLWLAVPGVWQSLSFFPSGCRSLGFKVISVKLALPKDHPSFWSFGAWLLLQTSTF